MLLERGNLLEDVNDTNIYQEDSGETILSGSKATTLTPEYKDMCC